MVTLRLWHVLQYSKNSLISLRCLSDVVAIDAGYWHVLALKSDGTVVTWGWDGYDLDIIPEGLDNVIADLTSLSNLISAKMTSLHGLSYIFHGIELVTLKIANL